MQGNRVILPIYIPGNLSANHTFTFRTVMPLSLLHVSACATNATNATLALGKSGAATDYMAAKAIGSSNVPAEFDRDDFVDEQYPHVPQGTDFLMTLDYDGSSGSAAAGAQVVLTFSEG